MSAALNQWRRLALKMIGHAAWVLPGARSGWAAAMRSELDYINDDKAALRWAVGCVTASYAARLASLPRLRWRVSTAPMVAASLLLLLAMALQGHASEETSPPSSDRMVCDRPDMIADLPSGEAAGCTLCLSKSSDPRPPSCLGDAHATPRSKR